jgi:hypothetical protein
MIMRPFVVDAIVLLITEKMEFDLTGSAQRFVQLLTVLADLAVCARLNSWVSRGLGRFGKDRQFWAQMFGGGTHDQLNEKVIQKFNL